MKLASLREGTGAPEGVMLVEGGAAERCTESSERCSESPSSMSGRSPKVQEPHQKRFNYGSSRVLSPAPPENRTCFVHLARCYERL